VRIRPLASPSSPRPTVAAASASQKSIVSNDDQGARDCTLWSLTDMVRIWQSCLGCFQVACFGANQHAMPGKPSFTRSPNHRALAQVEQHIARLEGCVTAQLVCAERLNAVGADTSRTIAALSQVESALEKVHTHRRMILRAIALEDERPDPR
jgi:hypothetical protein